LSQFIEVEDADLNNRKRLMMNKKRKMIRVKRFLTDCKRIRKMMMENKKESDKNMLMEELSI